MLHLFRTPAPSDIAPAVLLGEMQKRRGQEADREGSGVMLSLTRCREILGSNVEISDADLERVRDGFYILADRTIDEFTRRRGRGSRYNRGTEKKNRRPNEASGDLLPCLDQRTG